jgi:hypothetical protein
MTLDDLKREAALVAKDQPENRRKRIAKLSRAYVGNDFDDADWEFHNRQFRAIFDGDWRWDRIMEDDRGWLEEKFKKADAVAPDEAKRGAVVPAPKASLMREPLWTVRSFFNQALPVNPLTGKKNQRPLSIGGFCILACIIDQIAKNPKYNIKALMEKMDSREAVDLPEPVMFRVDTGDNRKKTGMGKKWTDEIQRKAYDDLAHWRLPYYYKFDPEKCRRKGGYIEVPVYGDEPFMGPREVLDKRTGKVIERSKLGQKSEAGKRINYVFEGRLANQSSAIVLLDIAYYQFHKIAANLGKLDKNELKFYLQGLSFIRAGWLVRRDFACTVHEGKAKDYPEIYWPRILKTLESMAAKVGWKRDLATEAAMKKDGRIGPGSKQGIFLRPAAQISAGKKRRKRLPRHTE